MNPKPEAACPDDERLRRLLAGHLPPGESEPVATHIETCVRCTARLDALAENTARDRRGGFDRKLVPESARSSSGHRPYLVASVAAGVLVGMLLVLRSGREPNVIEVAPTPVRDVSSTAMPRGSIRAFARTAGEIREVDEQPVALGPDDRVRFAVDATPGLHLLIAARPPGGAARVLWPQGAARSRALAPNERGFVALSVTAADAPADLIAILSSGETTLEDALGTTSPPRSRDAGARIVSSRTITLRRANMRPR